MDFIPGYKGLIPEALRALSALGPGSLPGVAPPPLPPQGVTPLNPQSNFLPPTSGGGLSSDLLEQLLSKPQTPAINIGGNTYNYSSGGGTPQMPGGGGGGPAMPSGPPTGPSMPSGGPSGPSSFNFNGTKIPVYYTGGSGNPYGVPTYAVGPGGQKVPTTPVI